MSNFQSAIKALVKQRSIGQSEPTGQSARVLRDQSQGPQRTIDEIRRKRLTDETYGRMIR